MKAKTIVISGHVNDMFTAQLKDEQGKEIASRDPNYVPSELGIGGGDDIDIEIDLATGKIVGWKTPSQETLNDVFGIDNASDE